MFTLADDLEIGTYLHRLSIEKYGSARKFGIACLKESNRAADESAVQSMATHLSEIKLGKTAVQLQDLPIFSRLLGVSCEEILSAGKSFAPVSDRLTNYSVSFSEDPQIWEKYINQKEQIILNADEYGKTVIDYALEFKNYDFLKYLMDNDYIWFVSADEKTGPIISGQGQA